MKSFFLLFCLLISFSSVAQKTNKVDHSKIIDDYKNQFRNAKSVKTKVLYADSIVDKLYYSNQDEALIYNDSMLYYALQLNDSILLFESKENLANIKSVQNDFLGALDIYFELLAYSKKIKSLRFESVTLNNISLIYFKMGDYEEAEKYNLKSLKIREKNKIDDKIYLNYQVLGSVYFLKGNIDESKRYFQEAIKAVPIGEIQHVISLYNNLASIEYKIGNFDRAKEIYKSCLMHIKTNDPDLHIALSAVYYNIAITLQKQKTYHQAILYLDSSLVSARLVNSKKDIAKAIDTKSDILQTLKRYDESWELKAEFVKYKDSITEDLKIEAITKLKESQQVKEYKDSLYYMNQLNQEFEKNTKLTKGINIAIVIVSLLLFLVFILYINFYRLKSKKEKAEMEQSLLRTQMNPHFIFNALNSIQRMYVEGNTDKANDFMADFSQLMRKVLENSSNTKITLQEEIDTLRLYLDLEQLRSKNCFSYTISVDENLSYDVKIPPLIIQPFVENAIWHGVLPLKDKHGEISVNISKKQNEIRVQITDNGIGYEPSQTRSNHLSKGIKITEQRIGEKVSVKSEKGNGTAVEFTIKVA